MAQNQDNTLWAVAILVALSPWLSGYNSPIVAIDDESDESIMVADPSNQSPTVLPQASSSEIIVRFLPELPAMEREAIVQSQRCSTVGSCERGNLRLVRIPAGETAQRMIAAFEAFEVVEYAEPDYHVSATFVPDDSFFSLQWNLGSGATGGIHMEAAWDMQRGDPNVIVAVLDTGVAYEDFGLFRQAPDLANTLFVPGYDFINDDSHPNDDQGHGTHVAGTIAQSTDNNLGVAGVAFGCSIMPVKILDSQGIGDHFTIAQGIYFAVEQGATIINLSLGGPDDSRTLRDAVAEAYRRGVTFVCSAGNEFEEGSPVSYPAAYEEFCIAVGAVRYDLTRAPYSNVGSYVDVVAPGGDLSIDQNGDGFADGILQQTFVEDPNDFAYWFFQGTSMAAPHVAGLAALLASRGVTSPEKIRAAIELTALDLGPAGWDHEYGWGVIDAASAVAYYGPGDLDANPAPIRRRAMAPGE